MGKRLSPRTGRRPAGHPLVAPLEPRWLMCAQHSDIALAVPGDIGFYPAVEQATPSAGPVGNAVTGDGIIAAGAPLGSLPLLSSNPSAVAKLYLDFDGDTTTRWGAYSPGTTPAFDADGDAGTFSSTELAAIEEIWARVAEKYSPFNLDVTTADPGNRNDFQTLRVVIGGDGSWFGPGAGGVAYVGGFINTASNTVFVFPSNLGNSAKAAAEAAAHESGHGFGLQHQGLWTNGVLTAEYHPGADGAAPIMGMSYASPRGQWWLGTPSTSATARQDDLAVLSNTSTNRFGYRADDTGNTGVAARPLSVTGAAISGAGVIEQTSDVDVFWLSTGAGEVNLRVEPVLGGMLDARITLHDASGGLVALADNGLSEAVTVNVPAGTYYLSVASHGVYGDIGQYTVSGSIVAAPKVIETPTELGAWAVSSRQINVYWRDNSASETAMELQRSSDGGASWSTVAVLSADSASYSDTAVSGGTSYAYRVRAYNATGSSAYCNPMLVTTRPDAPAALTAEAASPTQIDLGWADVSGEAGYRVERWVDGAGWVAVGLVPADATNFQSSHLSGGAVHYHRVVATSEAGDSAASQVVAAATPAAPRATARFAGNDYATKGTWQGVLGSEGYVIPGLAPSLPSVVSFDVVGATALSSGPTSDPRAVQMPGSPGARWASAWSGTGRMSFDFGFADGASHRLSMYLVDSQRSGHALHIEVIDVNTGRVLVQQPLSGFEEGRYLAWDVSGAVRIRVSALGPVNPAVAAFFIDPLPSAAPAGTIPAPSLAPAVAGSPRPPAANLFSYTRVLDWYRQQVRLRRWSVLTPE
jgi:hypothetical protein